MNYTTLISCGDLVAHLGRADWRVFDCRHQLTDPSYGESAYQSGHIPGAYFMHLDRDLSSAPTGQNGRHPLPDPEQLAAKLGAAGVGAHTQVVVYDDDGGMFAARLWWLLRWLGHDKVAVLDGSLKEWVRQGRMLDTALPAGPVERFEIRLREAERVTLAQVLQNLVCSEFQLVDARAPDRFRGENETLDPVGGHIPGAKNRFFRDNLDEYGRFRPADILREEYQVLLAGEASSRTVMYCGSGATGCHNLLAMEVAGLRGARLYAGSWSEWCADPSRPIAR